MRLIDADAFGKFIKEKYKDGESTDDIKDQMLFDLSYQPTAYDVEKVVESLKNHPNVFQEFKGCYIPLENAVEVVESNDGKGWWNE